jgi:aldehyde dehydrogenase (NAD+)
MTGTFTRLYVGGAWAAPGGSGTIDVANPATEERIGAVPAGTAADIDAAVAAARRAFDGAWGRTTPGERADWLTRLAAALEARAGDIARVISEEVGTPITLSKSIQAASPVVITRSFADLARTASTEETVGNSLVCREPIGVVGAITPWNYPLHQIMAKVAAALAAGCAVVLKPSEVAPLNAFLLAECCEAIGLPPGVLNIVPGEGRTVGEALTAHAGIDMVSFTGSLTAGRRVAAVASQTLKRVTLELGGKSACLVLDDAALDKAVSTGTKNAMLNSGQTCSAWTRLLVPRGRQDEAAAIARATLERLPVGDPSDPATRLGPLVSERQRARVETYIAGGRAEGATLVCGGGRPAGLARGHFVEPTVFSGVATSMTIAQEEIFGPVLAILPYDSEDDAVRIANDTIYGLAGAVWSADSDRALRVARRLRTGQVDINGARYNPLAPFGGYKQSGWGREFGRHGLEEFRQIKAIQR